MADRFDASAYLRGREVRVSLLSPETGEPEPMWFRLTNLEVARIEEHFGGTRGFDTGFEESPQTTMRAFLCIAEGAEVPIDKDVLESMSARMIPEEWPAYCAALETSWLLAHGGSEADAGKVWTGKVLLTQRGVQLTVDITQEAVKITTASPGPNGTKRGRASVVTPRSSGG